MKPQTIETLQSLTVAVLLFSFLAVTIGWLTAWNFQPEPSQDYATYHLEIAQEFSNGNFTAFFQNKAAKTNGGPYPPLFHAVVAGFIKLGIEPYAYLAMELAFYSLTLLSFAYVLNKALGRNAACIFLLLLMTSISFYDRVQVIPQTLDLLLFAAALVLFLGKHRYATAFVLTLAVWNHGAYAMPFAIALLTIQWLKDKDLKPYAAWFVLSIPILLLTVAYLPTHLSYATGMAHTDQETLARNNWQFAIQYFGLPIFIVALFAFGYYFAFQRKQNRFNYNDLMNVSALWLLLTIPVYLLFPDRAILYAAIPASIAGAAWLHVKLRENYKPYTHLAVIGLLAAYAVWGNLRIWIDLLLKALNTT